MNGALDAVVLFVLLVPLLCVALFGTVAAAVRRAQGGSPVKGFIVGALVGPLSLLWLAWKARSSTTAHSAPQSTPVPTKTLSIARSPVGETSIWDDDVQG